MIGFYIIFCSSVINICSATVVNYDLLVGEMSFYNRTLAFAFTQNEKHGTEILQIIENFMVPWHGGTLANEKNSVNECITKSKIFTYSVMIICKINRFGIFIAVVTMIMSFPCLFYLKIKSTINRKQKLNSIC